eukprot:3789292-Heterocapsa_arctica.AAC.1
MEALTGASNAFVLKLSRPGRSSAPWRQRTFRTLSRLFDSSGEIIRACEDMGILHEPSRPG